MKNLKNLFKLHVLTKDLRVPFDLNIARSLFYFLVLQKVLEQIDRFTNITYSYQSFLKVFWTPSYLFQFYPRDLLLSWGEIYFIYLLFCISLFFCMIGLYTRFFSIITAILALFCFGYMQQFGKIDTEFTLPIIILFVLAFFSQMSSSYSLQNFLKFKNKKKLIKSYDLFWNQVTLKFISILLLLFYFISGVQKIRFSGFEWITKAEILNEALVWLGHPYGEYLAQFPSCVKILAFFVILIQILSFIPIILPRLIPYWAILLVISFHLFLDMFISQHYFYLYIYTFVFLVPWSRLFYILSRGEINIGGLLENYSLIFLFKKTIFKQRILLLKLIGIITILGFFIVAPILGTKKLYPFPKISMYSYPLERDNHENIIKFFIFKKNKKSKDIISHNELWPIRRDVFISYIKKLYKQKEYEKIKIIINRLKENQPFLMRSDLSTFKNYDEILIEACYWKNLDIYFKKKNPTNCEILLKIKL